MYSYMLPQANVNHQQEKLENYLFDILDTNKAFFNHLIDSLDKCSGHAFTTYSSRVKNSVEYNIENAKEIIRTGKHKCPTWSPNKV